MNKIKILRIISVGLFIPFVVSTILMIIGLLDIKIMAIISWMVFVFMVEFIIFLIISKNHINISNTNVIIPKGLCENKIIMAETSIFQDLIGPTNPRRDCIFRISLQLKEFKRYPSFYIVRICEKDIYVQELNKDIRLDPGLIHIFDVTINRKEKLNFKFNENVTILKLLIEEIYVI